MRFYLLVPLFIRFLRERKVVSHIARNARMLDIGCGDGHFIISQSSRIKEGIGIDPCLAKPLQFGKVKLLAQSAEDLASYNENSFNVVTMLAVLEHIDDPKGVLQECWRVLSPGGLLLLTTPSFKAEGILHLLARAGLISRSEIEDHKRHFAKEELLAIFEGSGFLKEDIIIKPFEFGFNYFVRAYKRL